MHKNAYLTQKRNVCKTERFLFLLSISLEKKKPQINCISFFRTDFLILFNLCYGKTKKERIIKHLIEAFFLLCICFTNFRLFLQKKKKFFLLIKFIVLAMSGLNV